VCVEEREREKERQTGKGREIDTNKQRERERKRENTLPKQRVSAYECVSLTEHIPRVFPQ